MKDFDDALVTVDGMRKITSGVSKNGVQEENPGSP
jgi:hypothetical protein